MNPEHRTVEEMHLKRILKYLLISTQLFFLVAVGFALYHYRELLPRLCRYPFPFILCPVCDYPCFFKDYQLKTGLGILLSGIVSGRLFCGTACPVGSVQDGIYLARTRLFSKIKHYKLFNFNSSSSKEQWTILDRSLRILKYPVLFIVATYILIRFACAFDIIPVWAIVPAAMFTLEIRELAGEGSINLWLIFLISVFVIAIFVHRSWCKYLCPFGLMIAIFNKLSLLRVKFGRKLHLKKGTGFVKTCTTGKSLSDLEKSFDSAECVRCYRCVSLLPGAGVGVRFRGAFARLLGRWKSG